MIVLDTTVIIHFLKNNKSAVEKLASLNRESIKTTRLNVFEVLVGIYLKEAEGRRNEIDIFNEFLESVEILELDEKSSHVAARLKAELDKKGTTVHSNDVLIAAIALANGENKIVTQNAKDFAKISGILVENY
ncbi:type II toxin-antitoxin system VapC family toxin [Candidatus Micrarchaeota archaeon]|nr:type II toxin-antitoxin system VapC family toxin [Candidatus Micrarchaeota archaeon]